MKSWSVSVTTTYDGSYEVEAETEEDAIALVEKGIERGGYDPVSDFSGCTDIHFAEVV